MTAFERIACQTALAEMLRKSHFDICTVDQILKVTGTIAPRRTYEALRLLHCIHYSAMPPELLKAIPDMLAEVFNGPLLDVPGINFVSDSKTGLPRLAINQH